MLNWLLTLEEVEGKLMVIRPDDAGPARKR